MSIVFESKLDISEILNSDNKTIIANLDILANDYKEKTGKKLNRGCSSCISEMILTLKHHYNMSEFKFKRNAASYKNRKGDKTTISNSTITNEKAVEFLRTNPKRIELFSKFPSNWQKMVDQGFDYETKEEKEKRHAIEAEIIEVKKSKEANQVQEENEKAKLLKLSLKELRAKYPEIKASKITDFVDKVFSGKNELA